MKTSDIKNIASAYMQVLEGKVEEKKLDKVDPKALEKDFDDREDKDIDNDGDTDSSDEYLHNRRKAVKKAMKKEDTDMSESRWPILQRIMERQNHGNMDNGSPEGEGLSPSAKAELDKMKQAASTPAADGVQAAMDTIQNAAAGVKTAAKRPGDQATGDKTMPNNDGK